MPQVVSTTPGLYPLPDWAKERLADLKGRQKGGLISGDEPEAVVDAYDRAREEVIERQRTAGLDRIVEGQLRWDDMLAHPLAVADAVETRGIVRYYDNNNFYREPVVTGDLTATGDVAAELEDAARIVDDGLQAVLPGPYSLVDLATDEYYGDDATFLAAIGEFLAAEVERFPTVETLFLLEPSLLESPPDDDAAERARAAIDAIAGATDADVVVHPYWESREGDAALDATVYTTLLEADVDAIGFDLVTNREDNVSLLAEHGGPDDVALGLVDAQNTLVETPAEITEGIEWVLENTPGVDVETIYATTNSGLFFLPVSKFEEKLDALGAVGRAEVIA